MEKFKPNLMPALKSGLAYGGGLALGNLISALLFNIVSLEGFAPGNDAARLLVGLLLAFVIAGAGAAVGGFIGGYTLPVADSHDTKWTYAAKSALFLGLIYGFLLYPLVLIIALFSFYNIGDAPILVFMVLFALVGALIGLLFGLFFGGSTVGLRRSLRVMGYAIIGFGLGGLLLGITVNRLIYSFGFGEFSFTGRIIILLGLFIFGVFGGTAVALAYARYATEAYEETPLFAGLSPLWRWIIVIGALALVFFALIRPVMSAVRVALSPQEADLSRVLVSNTVGTHWLDPVNLSTQFGLTAAEQAQISVTDDNKVGLTWVADGVVMFISGLWDVDAKSATWQTPITVSLAEAAAETPQVAIDSQGIAHVAWSEAGNILYSQCDEAACSAPEVVSTGVSCAAGTAVHSAPTIAVNPGDSLLLAWETGENVLPVLNWSAEESPLSAEEKCVPTDGLSSIRQPRVSAARNGRFGIVFTAGVDADSHVYGAVLDDGWSELVDLGNGRYPELNFDLENEPHVIWCSPDGLAYWHSQESPRSLQVFCTNRPQVGVDSNGYIHAVWYSKYVSNVLGKLNTDSVLYEISQYDGGWTNPTIVDRIGAEIQPAMVIDKDGSLHMARTDIDDGNQVLQYQAQVQYSCDGYELSRLAQILYDVARMEEYRDPDTPVPYCQNRYDNLVYTPTADSAFTDVEPLINGAFDQMSQLADTAQYEVLLTTMWYDADTNGASPGSVIAKSVAKLYEKVKANPDNYPRGLTVRILLGNPPEFVTGDFTGQLWNVIEDVKEAGVPEMINEEIGWNLEVADYKGALPHSHSKMLVVDGKTVIAAGYNMTYDHYIESHPSGNGASRNDLGIQVTGPVAQDAVLAFDQLWEGSDQRHCTDFDPVYGVWQASCFDIKASAQHVPEVMKYYITDGNTTAFSMARNNVRDESDWQIANALAAAEKSIDTIQVNFTMEMICDLNVIYEVCTFSEALPYMESLVQAAENGAHIRILIKGEPVDGIESEIAVNILEKEIEKRGLEEQFELRYFDGAMHYKSINIDDELVIVGSQNFHYSASDPLSGLTEYNVGVVDEEAVEEYKALFEYHWQQGIPRDIKREVR